MQSIPFIPHFIFFTLTPSISIKCNNQYIIIYLHLPLGFFFFFTNNNVQKYNQNTEPAVTYKTRDN